MTGKRKDRSGWRAWRWAAIVAGLVALSCLWPKDAEPTTGPPAANRSRLPSTVHADRGIITLDGPFQQAL